MMSKDRFVVVGIIALAVIAALPLQHGFAWLFVTFGLPNPGIVGRQLPFTSLLAYGLGAAGALVGLYHRPTRQLATEVVDELGKVTWPTREETGNATVVVIVTVIICSAYLGVFDFVWLTITDWILGV